jgi:hypothetical protein
VHHIHLRLISSTYVPSDPTLNILRRDIDSTDRGGHLAVTRPHNMSVPPNLFFVLKMKNVIQWPKSQATSTIEYVMPAFFLPTDHGRYNGQSATSVSLF